MKKIISYYLLPMIAILFGLSLVISSYVSGPPAGNTNAPGENTCFASPACHGGTPNTGTGFGEMTIMGGIPAGNFYFPDSSYDMMPYIVDTTKLKGGFQAVSRLTSGLNAGTITITEPTNTQLISGGGFDYAEQTATGAVQPVMSNMHDWMFNWKAPSAGAGTVTFYVAFVAANGNNAPSGDNIYTDTLVLYEGTVGINELNATPDFTIEKVYPLPAKDVVNIDFNSNKNLELYISVLDVKGRTVISAKQIQINSTNTTHQINIAELTGGIYFINVHQNGKPVIQQKIIKFNR
ncbi:MAG: hypothetical protein COX70_03235 [Flavobacteriales bacterium CG_4_10_14_0_2_um_filter_32_8]|nr:MAG: hypothetical protein COX70_03235 [Flavobacteriales bacterium CG_4_10_14_0_2_um_filter_32_8]PJB13744.1 MAG: hypothetical protein CO118_12255 [Flavobacteriales bacterium CG_4_9_14_3_um_filter_32_8]